MDHPRPGRPVAVELDRIEADHEDEVARVDVVVEIGRPEALDRAEKERVILAEGSLGLRADDHRDRPRLGEAAQRPGHRVGVRVHSDDAHWPVAPP